MNPAETLAAHLAGISAAAVPAGVCDRSGLVLADTVGAIIAGQRDAAVAATVRRATPRAAGLAACQAPMSAPRRR